MPSFKDYEIIEHTADIGIRVKGKTLSLSMEKAILAISDLMLGEIEIKGKEKMEFIIREDDAEIALVSILEEILYIIEHKQFAISKCSVEIINNEYRVHLIGNKYKPYEIVDGVEVKAVTYHQLRLEETPDYWIINFILDV
ncbi:archease [candidate division WOR-3 bacterium]|nr:archease [candidate division WOR-3 bacterium]